MKVIVDDIRPDDPAAQARFLLNAARGFEAGSQQALEFSCAAIAHAALAVVERLEALRAAQEMVTVVACRTYGLYTASHVGADQLDARIDAYLTTVFKAEGTQL